MPSMAESLRRWRKKNLKQCPGLVDHYTLSLWAAAEEVEKWNLTKGRCWEYEQEERMFVMTQPDGVYEIDRKAHLEAIVLGARAPASFESDIESYVQRCRADLGIKLPLFKAQVSRTKCELEIPGFT